MKIISLLLLIMPIVALAQHTTTDRLTLRCDEIQPGGLNVPVQVSLEGSGNLYTAYQMDLTFPEAVDFYTFRDEPAVIMDTDGGLYPTTSSSPNGTTSHELSYSCSVVAPRTIRITCTSPTNEPFALNSGALFNFEVNTSSFTKPGKADLKLSNCKFVTYDAASKAVKGYALTQNVIEGMTISTTVRTSIYAYSDEKWNTCLLPFDSEIPEGFKVYTCDKTDGENLVLTEVERIEAFKPYIIYSEEGGIVTLVGEVNPEDYPESGVVTNGLLQGTINDVSMNEGYTLKWKNGEYAFHACDESLQTVSAGHCWLTLKEEGIEKYGFTIEQPEKEPEVDPDDPGKDPEVNPDNPGKDPEVDPDDPATGIQTSKTASSKSNATFNMNGQRVSRMQGNRAYIYNGKKIIFNGRQTR